MSANTIELNRLRQNLEGRSSIWLFGYGSLIYKADFSYLERRPAQIRGWVRRFWQGSHDHRGTPMHPGRVTTLVAQDDAVCAGMAYRVAPETFAHLDHREKNGYLRFTTALEFTDSSSVEGLVYIATADNEAWLGPASEADIARHIAASVGPSGTNSDYLLKLAGALRALGTDDAHVFAIEAQLRSIG